MHFRRGEGAAAAALHGIEFASLPAMWLLLCVITALRSQIVAEPSWLMPIQGFNMAAIS